MGGPTETAKAASDLADVRVVHDAERRVAHLVAGVDPVAYHVGRLGDFGPRGIFQNVECFGGGEPDSVNRFLQQ